MSKQPEFEAETAPNFKKIVIDGVIGSIDSIGLNVIIYSDQRIVDKSLESEPIAFHKIKHKRVAECELVMSPIQLKSIYTWMGEKLEEYEAIFGKVPSAEELQSRLKSYEQSKNGKKAFE